MIDEFDHDDFSRDNRDPKPVTQGDILKALLLLLERPYIIQKEMERRGLK